MLAMAASRKIEAAEFDLHRSLPLLRSLGNPFGFFLTTTPQRAGFGLVAGPRSVFLWESS
jgi:hypothetical protein